ncbi:MAG: DnaJ family domain-containing protein [Ruegeria sp.]
MFGTLGKLVERQIKKAQAEGQLDGLEGQGQPLPDRSSEALTDPALAAGQRIMAQAGVLPEEFTLKKQLDAARAAYAGLDDPAERKVAMARIADLEMRYNMARDARRAFLK